MASSTEMRWRMIEIAVHHRPNGNTHGWKPAINDPVCHWANRLPWYYNSGWISDSNLTESKMIISNIYAMEPVRINSNLNLPETLKIGIALSCSNSVNCSIGSPYFCSFSISLIMQRAHIQFMVQTGGISSVCSYLAIRETDGCVIDQFLSFLLHKI